MTDEEIRLKDESLRKLPTIQSLIETDTEILKDVEDLKRDVSGLTEGLENLSETVTRGFEKGRRRMDDIDGKIDKLDNSISMFMQRSETMHNDTISAVKDQRYQDLREEKKELQNQINEAKKKRWEVLKIIIGAFVGAIVSALAFHLTQG